MRKTRAAILGWGREGRWLFSYLKKNKNLELEVLDQKQGKDYLKNLSRFDIVYRSPGVPYNLPEIQKLKNKVSSLTRLFFEKAQGAIVGITGSAGKTTTASLLYKILKAAGKDAYLAGNIGKNPLAVLPKLSRKSITVLELSSFQLQDLEKSPKLAIILDIYEEHLDKHQTFREYLKAKAKLVRFQTKGAAVIYSADNKYSKKLARLSPGKKFPIFEKEAARYKTRLLGRHNLRNVAAAATAARFFGIGEKVIRKTVAAFRGLPHRLEFVREVRGVKFYNDSKATNLGSAIAGMDAFRENKVVLVGGYNKNLNFRPLARRLLKPDVSFIILFGKTRHELAGFLGRTWKFGKAKTLDQAVKLAQPRAQRGEVVLLAPAAASFDAFHNYEERGERFRKLVSQLK